MRGGSFHSLLTIASRFPGYSVRRRLAGRRLGIEQCYRYVQTRPQDLGLLFPRGVVVSTVKCCFLPDGASTGRHGSSQRRYAPGDVGNLHFNHTKACLLRYSSQLRADSHSKNDELHPKSAGRTSLHRLHLEGLARQNRSGGGSIAMDFSRSKSPPASSFRQLTSRLTLAPRLLYASFFRLNSSSTPSSTRLGACSHGQ